MSFGDLELHGHFDIFSLVYTKVVPGRLKRIYIIPTTCISNTKHPKIIQLALKPYRIWLVTSKSNGEECNQNCSPIHIKPNLQAINKMGDETTAGVFFFEGPSIISTPAMVSKMELDGEHPSMRFYLCFNTFMFAWPSIKFNCAITSSLCKVATPISGSLFVPVFISFNLSLNRSLSVSSTKVDSWHSCKYYASIIFHTRLGTSCVACLRPLK